MVPQVASLRGCKRSGPVRMRARAILLSVALAWPVGEAVPSPFDGVAGMQSVAMGPVAPLRSNAGMARDILDLAFELESGRELPGLSRFEGPVRVRVAGAADAGLRGDLDALLARLRAEAGLDIGVTASSDAEIVVEIVPRAAFSVTVPDAACFVVPGASSWGEFLAERGTPDQDWTTLHVREQAAIFIPGDAAPQAIRDCLHEEIAQALGPLNDLYRLPDSVFNDDNVHVTLTGFDMLVLRVLHEPELRPGMTREEVAARLPALLARVNPQGEQAVVEPDLPRAWSEAIGAALSRDRPGPERRRAAEAAVAMARGGAGQGLALLALGRSQSGYDPESAQVAFSAALRAFDASSVTAAYAAQAQLQLAALALQRGSRRSRWPRRRFPRPSRKRTRPLSPLCCSSGPRRSSCWAGLRLPRRHGWTASPGQATAWARTGHGAGWATCGAS